MLSVLKFKSSMAAGILDGGEDASGIIGEFRTEPAEEPMEEPQSDAPDALRLPEDAGGEAPERDETVKGRGFDGVERNPQVLLKSGLDFLSGLSLALSKPETTKQLVDSIISEDPSDGKTYLKIPIESRQVGENIFGLIGSMMKGRAEQ